MTDSPKAPIISFVISAIIILYILYNIGYFDTASGIEPADDDTIFCTDTAVLPSPDEAIEGVSPPFEPPREPRKAISPLHLLSREYNITAEEFHMLCCVIQREVDHLGIEHKRIIAQVILNRVRSERFPDTVSQVLHQKNQFPTIINYYETTFIPDEVTVRAASDMISGNAPDMSRGALFFYDPEYTSEKAASWFEEELEYLFTMDCHRFFKYP